MGGRSLQGELPDAHGHVPQGQGGVEAHPDALLATSLSVLEGFTQHRDELEKHAQMAPTFSVSHYQLALAA